MQLVSIEATSR